MPYLGQNRKGAADKVYRILVPLKDPILEKINVISNGISKCIRIY